MTSRGRGVLSALAVVILFALPLIPEIVGTQRLIFRDAQLTHWPWRRVAVEALSAGDVPFINAHASGGQPLLANPNAVLLYPTFLLELILPPVSAFNLHYLVHVLWAFLGARVLARRLGLSEGAAFLSGVAFGFSGMMLSYGSAFMNSAAAAAWLPWCGAAALDLARARGTRQTLSAVAALGIALGLQLLAGEPALSLLTAVFAAGLAIAEAAGGNAAERWRRFGGLAAGATAAGLLAFASAAALLLPLRQVLSLTYRGQHLYSKAAFGAAAFEPWQLLEWLFPRLGGNPGVLGGEATWLRPADDPAVIYIWCLTLGVIPFLLVSLAALRRDFWDRRSVGLASGGVLALLFSFGFALPFYPLLYEVAFLRRLRYPIKFYLLTSLCAALLAGLAAESLSRRRLRWRERAVLVAVLALCVGGWILAGRSGLIDRTASALARDPAVIAAYRADLCGDALLGAAGAILVGILFWRSPRSSPRGHVLGLATILMAFVWGLPLFVTAASRELARPPALLRRLEGSGRVYVSPELPRFDARELRRSSPSRPTGVSPIGRVLVEQLIASTGAPFGIRYLFDTDPDGSYGYYNRIAHEAAGASTPIERDRLLRLYGVAWVLAAEGDAYPLFRPATGLAVAGKRLVLWENPDPLPELRWAGRVHRRRSLSGTLELLRSEQFEPQSDLALPGREDRGPSGPATQARVAVEKIGADRAVARVEASGAGFLIFSRTFFTAWKARLDAAPVPVLVGNARDLAVAVPAGRHRVELALDRSPFRRGVALQAIAFFLSAGVAIAARRPRAVSGR